MEIVAIEAQTFDRMLQRLKDMARITDEIYKMHGERKIGGWMDSQDACLRLGVSPVPCKHSVTMGPWHTAGSVTRFIIG